MQPVRSPRHPRLAVVAVASVVALASAGCDDPGAGGSPVCRRGSPRLTVFQGPAGECLPRSRVVGYRCEDADPIVVFDAGGDSERRFLGGSFTVPVPALPDDAELLGVGDGAQLVSVHDDPRRLYTVRGSSVWRWLALPDPSRIDGQPQAFMLGDSLLDGGAPAVVAALPDWSLEIDASNGRGSSTGVGIVEARTTEDQVAVIELGTNDRSPDAFAANAARILSALRRVPLVLWQNVEGPPDVVPADEINTAIETLAGRRPNVAIADWDAAVPEEYLSDGVHPDPEHQDAIANLLAPMLERWRTAVLDRAPCD